MGDNSNCSVILVDRTPGITYLTINRLSRRNSINLQFLAELNALLDTVEQDPSCKVVVIQGQEGVFCTGMDFGETLTVEMETGQPGTPGTPGDPAPGYKYMNTIRRLSLIPKITTACVDGQAMAGGVGLAAACDIVIATPRSQFSLSEALWGLLPAMVLPYLIRRVGFQKAYWMTLTTLPITAEKACAIHLADEISENPVQLVQHLAQRLTKLEVSTIGNIKQYFRKLWFINESMEDMAVSEITRRMTDPEVLENLKNFVTYKKFPWEK